MWDGGVAERRMTVRRGEVRPVRRRYATERMARATKPGLERPGYHRSVAPRRRSRRDAASDARVWGINPAPRTQETYP